MKVYAQHSVKTSYLQNFPVGQHLVLKMYKAPSLFGDGVSDVAFSFWRQSQHSDTSDNASILQVVGLTPKNALVLRFHGQLYIRINTIDLGFFSSSGRKVPWGSGHSKMALRLYTGKVLPIVAKWRFRIKFGSVLGLSDYDRSPRIVDITEPSALPAVGVIVG